MPGDYIDKILRDMEWDDTRADGSTELGRLVTLGLAKKLLLGLAQTPTTTSLHPDSRHDHRRLQPHPRPLRDQPPPLTLPPALPKDTATLSKAKLSHVFASGVAYLKFYKTGIKHIYTNTRLLYSSSSTTNPDTLAHRPDPSTRAHLHLRLRWRHDVRRLPLFALILVVCGEFTPLVVLALPGAVPLPCRIPRQVEKLLGRVEGRRREGRDEVGAAVAATTGGAVEPSVVAWGKILGLPSHAWTPGFVLASRVERRLRFLAVDDGLLVQSSGAKGLVAEEVRLACADRGVDVLGRGEDELRAVLGLWLRSTDARRLGEEGREKAVRRLLLAKDSEWAA
ncbi:hypothetical protein C8A00DRAFT_32837 [Chaetomidium leptoderma]|uniref:Letm1 RBD domain-containing protein n=1 Tax=Chaetomidium leptoderma TaxID=669021 RepID=A0AAN6VMQ3_9PEZI|nr:hypothetical protein C8A00DRAFT_32837 [Chaetomidium leptoderma]